MMAEAGDLELRRDEMERGVRGSLIEIMDEEVTMWVAAPGRAETADRMAEPQERADLPERGASRWPWSDQVESREEDNVRATWTTPQLGHEPRRSTEGPGTAIGADTERSPGLVEQR